MSRKDILWTPAPEEQRGSNLWRFAEFCEFDPGEYDDLHRWSVSDKGDFWSSVWDFCNAIGDKGVGYFLADDSAWMTGARFFPEARLNLAENLLMKGADNAVAVCAMSETGAYEEIARGELRARVGRVARGLLAANVFSGDRVAGIQANGIDGLVAALASLSIGAVWTSCSPDFGADAIVDRIGQVSPKVVFADLQYSYGGKTHDIAERVAEIRKKLPSVEVLVCSNGSLPDSVVQSDFGEDAPLEFTRVPFDHPAYVLYTSGTTGAPKAIVHRTGGVLLQHLKEHILHGDVRPGDRVMWYTNTAWMMYHWMISALAANAAIVLYDGAPIRKTENGLDCSPLWRLVEKAGITHFGTSPKYLATLADEKFTPGYDYDLATMRALFVCGAPCLPHQFEWVYSTIKSNIYFASISGGTEILGSFLIGSPLHSVRRGELTVPALGHAVAVLDDRGAPVIGQRGELVCTEPFPSMPLTFWGEGGDQRYHDTYFGKRPEIWTHGDIAEMTVAGGAYIYGRSDDTLKPGGVRIGISEIYVVCESYPELEDFLVFGANHEGDEEVVLAIKPAEGATIDTALVKRLRSEIRTKASPRHVPARIHLVDDVPYTINGKRVESAVRALMNGNPVKNLGSIRNPESLDQYKTIKRGDAF